MATKTQLVKLKPESALAQLNQMFPAGIPTVGDEPKLLVMNQDCWELNLNRTHVSIRNRLRQSK